MGGVCRVMPPNTMALSTLHAVPRPRHGVGARSMQPANSGRILACSATMASLRNSPSTSAMRHRWSCEPMALSLSVRASSLRLALPGAWRMPPG
ncbi:hypothetical protein ACTMU2_15690 [Cupriavidus basilensis]